MEAVKKMILKVARSSSTVLIRGESGTGKELIARAIHNQSPRNSEMFQAVNCAAINENLLESELFGHEKGSFTGAHADKKGLVRGGRPRHALPRRNCRARCQHAGETSARVAGTAGSVAWAARYETPVDVRVVAATNRDLRAMVADGRFRDDLYYRINVLSIDVPPLRERREDIPVLIDFFSKKHTRNTSRLVRGLTLGNRNGY